MKKLTAYYIIVLISLLGCQQVSKKPNDASSIKNILFLSIRGKSHTSLSAQPGTQLTLSPIAGDRSDGSDYEIEDVEKVSFQIAWQSEYWLVDAVLADGIDVQLSIQTRTKQYSSDIGWQGKGASGSRLTIRKFRLHDKQPYETIVQSNKKTTVTRSNGKNATS